MKFYCSAKFYLILALISFALFLISLLVAFWLIPYIIDTEIAKNVRLEDGTDQYDRFIKLPFPLRFSVYLFQVENPDEVLTGTKPKLTEIGPFVYDENRGKTLESYDTTEDTISYTNQLTFTYNKELSNGLDENTIVQVLNPAYWVIYQKAEDLGVAALIEGCMKSFFKTHNGIFINITARELLFDGVKFMESKGSFVCSIEYPIIYPIAASIKFDENLDDGTLKFSFLKYKERLNDGLYTVNRGIDDVSKLGSIIRLNNETHTKYWSNGSATCDEVKGTDSTIYPPHIKTETVLSIYSTDICRHVEIYYQQENTFKDIDGYQFGTSNETLRPSTTDPEDDCFCTKTKTEKTKDMSGSPSCYLDGLLDLQPCTDVPVILSFPHFLYAEQYLDYVEITPPDVERHGMSLLVEPNTGTPLKGNTRIQFNMVLRPITGVGETKNIARAVLPLIWVEEGFELPDKYVDVLNDMYLSKKKLADIVQWTFIGVTAVMFLIFSGVFMRVYFFKHE